MSNRLRRRVHPETAASGFETKTVGFGLLIMNELTSDKPPLFPQFGPALFRSQTLFDSAGQTNRLLARSRKRRLVLVNLRRLV